jgi:hypothetical protein
VKEVTLGFLALTAYPAKKVHVEKKALKVTLAQLVNEEEKVIVAIKANRVCLVSTHRAHSDLMDSRFPDVDGDHQKNK